MYQNIPIANIPYENAVHKQTAFRQRILKRHVYNYKYVHLIYHEVILLEQCSLILNELPNCRIYTYTTHRQLIVTWSVKYMICIQTERTESTKQIYDGPSKTPNIQGKKLCFLRESVNENKLTIQGDMSPKPCPDFVINTSLEPVLLQG